MASTSIEFSPRYRRYPPALTELLIRIAGALGARVLETRGSGSATRYVFSAAGQTWAAGARRGRPTTWNDTLIERELRGFLADRDRWPSPKQFQDAGRGDLYAAASRSGGIARWRRMLGL